MASPAKVYLSQLNIKYKSILREIDKVNLLESRVTLCSRQLKKDRVQSNSTIDFSDIMDQLIDQKDKVQEMMIEYNKLFLKINQEIQTLDNPTHRLVLFGRYIVGKDLKSIAEDANYSYSHIRRVHGQALNAFYHKILIR